MPHLSGVRHGALKYSTVFSSTGKNPIVRGRIPRHVGDRRAIGQGQRCGAGGQNATNLPTTFSREAVP